MSNICGKNKERISNIKSLILKGEYNNLTFKSRNIKLSTLGKIFSSLEQESSERRDYNLKKLSFVNKTTIYNTTREDDKNIITKLRKIIYINKQKNKSLSKEGNNKVNDLSFNKNKKITVNKIENVNKNKLTIYKNQSNIQRPLSIYSGIKLNNFKFLGNNENICRNKMILNQKMMHSRNIKSNIGLVDNIKNYDKHNYTQRNNYTNNNKNLLISLKNKLKNRILKTSRNKSTNKSTRKKTSDNLLNKSLHLRNIDSNYNNSKDEDKSIYLYNTYEGGDSSLDKSNITINKYNHYKKTKKCAVSLINPSKKIINKTLPNRDQILDSVHINKFNSNNFLNKYKNKPFNNLYKIPLEIKNKFKNKLNISMNFIKNQNKKISNEKNSKNIDNSNKLKNRSKKNSFEKKINKNEKPNEQRNIEKKIIKKKNNLTNNYNFKIVNKNKLLNLNTDSINQNLLFSPTSSITKENTISIKDVITKRIMKIDSCTIAGYSSPGIQKINQDNFFIIKEFLGDQEQFYLGVCDGHGINGHLVSEYISKNMPNYLQDTSDESIIKSFNLTNNSLMNNSKIDCSLSGSTCTTLIVNLEKIICANLGDSRAVLAKYENGIYTAINLSQDHKPNNPNEMKRILMSGGRIKPFYDEEQKKYLGPERVWLKNSDIPGLAMTRSIGDNVAHSVGVISEPEIIKYEFIGNEKFIILASDGIWEYIDSDECVNIIKDFYENNMDAIGALNSLVKEAFLRWKNMEDSIDDITAIVIFFE